MTNRGVTVAATLLLLTEYLALSLTFDVQPLRDRAGVVVVLGWMGAAAPLVIVIAAALMVVRPSSRRSGEWAAPQSASIFFALHLINYGALWWATTKLHANSSWAWVWMAFALSTVVSLVLATTSFGTIRRFLGANKTATALTTIVALAGFGLAALSTKLWPLLVEVTLIGAATMLMAWGEAPLLLPDRQLLGVGDFVVEVSSVCSGMEGVGLILVFLTAYIILDRRRLRLPTAWVALPLAVLAVLFANVVRIAALVWLGGNGWPDVAMGGFHSKAGWILFSAVALGATALTGRTFGRVDRLPTASASGAHASDAAPFLIPLLTMIAAGMVGGLFVTQTYISHPFVVVAGLGALWWARRRLPSGLLEAPHWGRALVYGVLVFALWMATPSEPDFTGARRLATAMDEEVWWIASKVLGAVIIVPIAEELAFRGFLQRRLSSSAFETLPPHQTTWWALVVASVVFGLLHQDTVAAIGAGLVYGWLYRFSGRLSDAVAAHAVTNALLAATVLLSGAWWLWS